MTSHEHGPPTCPGLLADTAQADANNKTMGPPPEHKKATQQLLQLYTRVNTNALALFLTCESKQRLQMPATLLTCTNI
jgi:hypothetical protein